MVISNQLFPDKNCVDGSMYTILMIHKNWVEVNGTSTEDTSDHRSYEHYLGTSEND